MRLSADTYIPRKLVGDRETINLFAKAGMDAMDYSLYWHEEGSEAYGSNYRSYAKELRALAEKNAMVFNQTHAPFDCYIFGDDRYNQRMLEATLHAIEFSALLGANYVIVHPIVCPEDVDRVAFNKAYYEKLLPACEKYKINIAIENIFTRVGQEQRCVATTCSSGAELVQLIDLLQSEWIVGCIDVGHAQLVGEAPDQMVRTLGDRLKCLHIHDNNAIKDLHLLPYQGDIQWDTLLCALVETGYEGDLTLEFFGWLQQFNVELLPYAIEFAVHVGRELIGKIKGLSKDEKEGVRI